MEGLIKRAFLDVEVLGPQVQRGEFNLIGPNGNLLIPRTWEKDIQPGFEVTMVLWPDNDYMGGHSSGSNGIRGYVPSVSWDRSNMKADHIGLSYF